MLFRCRRHGRGTRLADRRRRSVASAIAAIDEERALRGALLVRVTARRPPRVYFACCVARARPQNAHRALEGLLKITNTRASRSRPAYAGRSASSWNRKPRRRAPEPRAGRPGLGSLSRLDGAPTSRGWLRSRPRMITALRASRCSTRCGSPVGRSLSQFGYIDSERPEAELRGTDRLGIAR